MNDPFLSFKNGSRLGDASIEQTADQSSLQSEREHKTVKIKPVIL